MAPPSFHSVDIFSQWRRRTHLHPNWADLRRRSHQNHHRIDSAVAPIHLQSSLDPTASRNTACPSCQTGAALSQAPGHPAPSGNVQETKAPCDQPATAGGAQSLAFIESSCTSVGVDFIGLWAVMPR
uniref:Uncharacterized protein n=1 Tax=Oryza glumipatula TaxID=40148 RepID=A0A0D9ZBR9_9ORYZ